ncbi:hypothetical protein CANTEDRAFT_129580 [Yamadazyma tenuis ATCC 10573]|uniref:CYK3 C-terminal Ig-like domain-containing protein n=1 Tax=Candida tenuis (strain ATCC 10573 / BCRC 21748 / CBS 615 / JCM 9827 / NBRC 10315 / NRRL Y-1498 / VKM Y-70) TaxID=590646 RepID=G3B022_CANTC|nr:uncharacterized protein CANTEDRAFT_129580 [Yamadazyma tenuis ATCC 10573]EGV65293.1 hypothetical protein CANTEDRAFT_129580 [Yamadazyma tenuis ATCC 10573]
MEGGTDVSARNNSTQSLSQIPVVSFAETTPKESSPRITSRSSKLLPWPIPPQTLQASRVHSSSKHQKDDSRQREIERFKVLQQQQEYHIKKASEMDRQKRLSQQDFGRTSVLESPTQSKHNGGALNQNYEFNNQTVESFSPESSPRQMKSKQNLYSLEDISSDPELDEIALKKKQLELEILHLEELQRSSVQKKNKSSSSPNRFKAYDHSNDSYISEDLISSKKNYHSREDLSKKLSRYPTDEEIDDYEYGNTPLTISDSNSPPPPPPKHNWRSEEKPEPSRIPYDADDFRFSGNGNKIILTEEEFLSLSQVQQEELKNSIKSLQSDVLNFSEFSATSAGSFLRHKYEKEYQAEQEIRMKNLSLQDELMPSEMNGENKDEENKNLMDTIFQDKKSRHPNIFKKLLKKKDDVTNPLEQRMQQEEGEREIDWTTFKSELNRMNSLTSQDKQARTKRVVREELTLIVKPLEFLSDINTNETIDNDFSELKFSSGCFEKVDTFASRYNINCDLNDLISDIGVKFGTNKVSQLRAVLIHFAKFVIIEETGKIQQTKPKLNDVLMKGEGSVYQLNYLLKKVLDALRIPSEVVLGFWKKPNEFYHDEQYIINHCWLSVIIENQFLFVDLLNFKDTEICNIRQKDFNEFYFLAPPLSLISTHIPSVIDLQHVTPPIDQNIAFYLPRLYCGYYKNNLKFVNFNNALTRLKDSEIFEMDMKIPTNVELFTLIKTSKVTSNEFSLCQVYWKNNSRYAKIKAILPEDQKIGVLQIFSGEKGLQKHFKNIHELSVVVPIYHQGESKPVKFVPRYPTVQSQNNDLYVKSPQTNKIMVRNSYNFEILQHPSAGLTNSSKILNQDFKIVIESPSGKYFKLSKTDPNKPYGSFESMFKCQELGLYRGLVIGDSGNSWYVFAQWECTPGTVT